MRRVVITGMGIWSCIGQDLQTVTESLRQGRSGIIFDPKRIEYGLQSGLVGNVPRPDLKPFLPRKFRATMSEDAEYAYMAARQAFAQANMDDNYLYLNEVGCIWGNDGNSSMIEASKIMDAEHDSLMLGPHYLFKTFASSVSMNLSTIFHLKGVSMVVGSACASSSHAIGLGLMYIRAGMQDMVLVGGSSEINQVGAAVEDAISTLSIRNDDPLHSSRPFDAERDGFVVSGGAAALVLEEYEHAKARGATIFAEITGYGFSSNGIEEIYAPYMKGEYSAILRAIHDSDIQPYNIDYVNAHATSTIEGDVEEAKTLTRLFVSDNRESKIENRPYISSTKSLTGHECWMAGASEAVYSILMMQNNFVAPNINLENIIEEAKDLNIVRETIYTPINTVLSNSSGMGGTNSALVFRKI